MIADPGVLIAARLSGRGAPAEMISRWLSGHFDLVISPELIAELDSVLRRPKFRRWTTIDEVDAFVAFLEQRAIIVADPPVEAGLTRDPNDDYLVSLANAARIDVLVSGGGDLLAVDSRTSPVRTPRAFIELLDTLDGP